VSREEDPGVKTILVVSGDRIGRSMSGPGIRSYHFARILARRFQVTLVAPLDGAIELAGVDILERPTQDELAALALSRDVVVAQYLPASLVRRLSASRTRTVYDVYVPSATEGLAWLAGEPANDGLGWRATALLQRLQLATGDAFVCASERQRDLFVGMLAELGRIDRARFLRDPSLRELIDVVPFGIDPAPPPRRAQASGTRTLLWTGGLWNWLDPLTPIRAFARLGERRRDLELVFLGSKHPDLEPMAAVPQARAEAERLGVLDNGVRFHEGWVPYAERAELLAAAAVGISAHRDTVEARYAFRTRFLDHFWAGLPTVTTHGDVLAELVEREGLGVTVAPGDVDGYADALERMVDDPPRDDAFADVRERFAWERVAEPLVRLVDVEAPKQPASTLPVRAALFRLRVRSAMARRLRR
jgi:glycosyltransferase involved in cell wall biosynthesis